MFGIGFGELIVIILIGIVVLGPQRSMSLATKLGTVWGKLHAEWSRVKREVNNTLHTGQNDPDVGPS